MDLRNQIALVTGASRGIGKAIALRLAEHGADVVGTATSDQGAENISNYFSDAGLPGKGHMLDVADDNSVNTFAKILESNAQAPSILVNNAGITRDNLLMRMKSSEWDDVINTNLGAMYRLSKVCVRAMMKQKYGRIINISSVVAQSGNPGQSNYVASKAGIIGFTKSLAAELASRNITVNAVAPGFIETDMTDKMTDEQKTVMLERIPAGRLGKPDDIAEAVLFLASPVSGYITGETINVNGGLYMA